MPDSGQGAEFGLQPTSNDIKVFLTRPKPARGWQGLDWIVEPEYSFRVFST